MQETAKKAKTASYKLAMLSTELKNRALIEIAKEIEKNQNEIFDANNTDLKNAQKLLDDKKITKSTFDRLKLDGNKMRDMIQGIKDVAALEDPVNKTLCAMELDKGLELYKISTPIGVLGVIFEARPDVIAQICSLAIKSANVVLLKGGVEAQNTNIAITKIINDTLDKLEFFPKNVINLLFTRDDVNEMLKMNDFIDLIIPRGGNELVKFIKENTKIPVLGHADGICHIYIDESADIEKAIKICIDSKIQYPSACNSVETILINKNFMQQTEVIEALENTNIKIIKNPKNWSTEYGEKIVSLKIVDNIDEAIEHINKYSSHHTDCIITENISNAQLFMNLVDSAGVFHNASTRFSDGFRYGLGAEVGISTNKTHARGPVGLEGLTIYKYKLSGSGQIVDDYVCGKSKFTHKQI